MIDSITPTIIYPNGYKPGCLYRRSKPGTICPMAADRIKIIPKADWDAVAAEIADNLPKHIPVVLDQDGVGSCATESSTGGVMLVEAIQGNPFVLLNPWYVYRVVSGGRDQGSSIDDCLAFIRENGVAPESLHPRSLGWRAKPSDEAIEAAKQHKIEEFYDISNINEFVSALLAGFPVVFGSNGHAILGVRYTSGYPEILNSWNKTWGSNGLGKWCSWNAIEWSYGAWALRVTS